MAGFKEEYRIPRKLGYQDWRRNLRKIREKCNNGVQWKFLWSILPNPMIRQYISIQYFQSRFSYILCTIQKHGKISLWCNHIKIFKHNYKNTISIKSNFSFYISIISKSSFQFQLFQRKRINMTCFFTWYNYFSLPHLVFISIQ